MEQLTESIAPYLTTTFLKRYNEMITEIMEVLTEIITDYDCKERAEQFASDTYRVFLDSLLWWRQQLMGRTDLKLLKYSFRYVCSSITNAYKYARLDEGAALRIAGFIEQTETEFVRLLGHNASPSTKARIDSTVGFIRQKSFVLFASKHPRFKEIVYSLVYYLEKTKP